MPIYRDCPVCAGTAFEPIKTLPSPDRPMGIVICTGCGLVFVNPTYTETEKSAASPQVTLLHRSRAFNNTRAGADRHSGPRVDRCLAGLTPHLHSGNRVLEVGFGDGLLLSNLCERGMQAAGIEMDGESAQRVGRELGIPVHIGTFEDIQLNDVPRFDAVIMAHLIEHFYDPVAALRKVHSLLAPGGVVFLETPNILRPKVSPRRLYSFAHNFHFSPRTLACALHRAGFDCEMVREFRIDSFQIVARARKSGEVGVAPRGDDPIAIRSHLRRYEWSYTTSLQFLWRKLPVGRRMQNQVRRQMRGSDLAA
jgi:2-polyprenyl-3-methyl-5-hydroxy-6-metoxy-1,4-benzoquinol methylase